MPRAVSVVVTPCRECSQTMVADNYTHGAFNN
jgi:hypothetical protein